MQTHTNNLSLAIASPKVTQSASSELGVSSQNIDLREKNHDSDFLKSLQELASELQAAGKSDEAGALSGAIEQFLTGRAANNSLALPFAEGQIVAVGTELGEGVSSLSIEALLAQIKQGLSNTTEDFDAGLQARIATLASLPAHVDADMLGSPLSSTSVGMFMGRGGSVNQSILQLNSMDTAGDMNNLSQAFASSAMFARQQLKPGQENPINDTELNSLLNRETALTNSMATSTNLSPILMERALLNMGQANRQAASDLLNSTDISTSTLATLQSGQSGRSGMPASLVEARPQQTIIQVPLTDPQWQTDFSNRIVMLAKGAGPGQAQIAEIRLNPAHMGPIEVRVVMNDDQASVTFSAQHSAVRDAIDSSLPRLREMFNGTGLLLSDTEVSDQSLNDRRQNDNQNLSSQEKQESEFYHEGESRPVVTQTDASHLLSTSSLDLYA